LTAKVIRRDNMLCSVTFQPQGSEISFIACSPCRTGAIETLCLGNQAHGINGSPPMFRFAHFSKNQRIKALAKTKLALRAYPHFRKGRPHGRQHL